MVKVEGGTSQGEGMSFAALSCWAKNEKASKPAKKGRKDYFKQEERRGWKPNEKKTKRTISELTKLEEKEKQNLGSS